MDIYEYVFMHMYEQIHIYPSFETEYTIGFLYMDRDESYIHTNVYIYIYMYIYMHMYIYEYMFIYIYMYIYMHMYIYIYVYIYIQMYNNVFSAGLDIHMNTCTYIYI
jgi:hypothetical protein